MPRKYKKKRNSRYGKRRSFKKFKRHFRKYRKFRRRGGRSKLSYKKLGMITKAWPDQLAVKHMCTLPLQFSSFNGTNITNVASYFQLNSMNDVQLGLGNIQPQGYDQMTTLYKQYRVKACKIKTRMQIYETGTTASATVPAQIAVSIYPFVDSTSGDIGNIALNQQNLNNLPLKFCKQKLINPGTPNMAGGHAMPFTHMKNYVNCVKLYGAKFSQADATVTVDDPTGPFIKEYWAVMVGSSVGGFPPATLLIRGYVTITFYAIWERTRDLLGSTTATTSIATFGDQTSTIAEAVTF